VVGDIAGDCRLALRFYTAAVAAGGDPYFYYKRGNSYQCLRRYGKAIVDYTTALKLHPEGTGLYLARGKAYYRLNRYQDALTDLDKAIGLDRMSPRALVARGRVFYALDKPDAALRDLNDSLV